MSEIVVTPEGRFCLSREAYLTLQAHGLLVRLGGDEFRLALRTELRKDPGSAGVNNPVPDAVLAVVKAALSAMPNAGTAEDSDIAGAAPTWTDRGGYMERTDRSQILNEPADGAWVLTRDHLNAMLTEADRAVAAEDLILRLGHVLTTIAGTKPGAGETAADLSLRTKAIAMAGMDLIGKREPEPRLPGPDRDSLRLLRQFADMYRSGAQGAEMNHEAAQALALSIDDVLSSLPQAE